MFFLLSLLGSHLQALKKTLFRVLLGHPCDTAAFEMCLFLCLKTGKFLVLAIQRGLFSIDIHFVGKAPRVEGRKDCLLGFLLLGHMSPKQQALKMAVGPSRYGVTCREVFKGKVQRKAQEAQPSAPENTVEQTTRMQTWHFVTYLIYFCTHF